MAWALLGVVTAIEVCVSLWASDLLRSRAGMLAGAATPTLSAVVFGTLVGTLVGSRLAVRVAAAPLLRTRRRSWSRRRRPT